MRWTHRVAVASLVAGVLLSLPSPAGALAFRKADRSGNVVVPAGETIDDDLYVSGNTVDVKGTVLGSVFAAGNDVSVEGGVGGDIWAAGNTVRVDSVTSGTVHAAGNNVTVSGRTGRDVTVAGSTVRLEPNLAVGRDAAMAGATLVHAGTVDRNLYIGGGNVTVAGRVGRDVIGDADKLTLASGSRVGGDVRYRSGNDARVEPDATVGGRVQRSALPSPREIPPAQRALLAFLGWLRRLIGLALFGLLIVLLFPLFTRRATDRLADAPLLSLGAGFAVLVLTPVAATVAFVLGLLIGGWWIALMLLALYWIAVAVATIMSAVFVGRLILRGGTQATTREVFALLLGLLVLTILEAIPVLGILVRMAEVLFGLGALILTLAAPVARPAQAQAPPPPAPGLPPSGMPSG